MAVDKEVISKQTDDVKARLWWLWVFFSMTLMAGVYTFKNPAMLGIFAICLTFLIFNGVMLLYKMIIISTKRLREELSCPSQIQP